MWWIIAGIAVILTVAGKLVWSAYRDPTREALYSQARQLLIVEDEWKFHRETSSHYEYLKYSGLSIHPHWIRYEVGLIDRTFRLGLIHSLQIRSLYKRKVRQVVIEGITTEVEKQQYTSLKADIVKADKGNKERKTITATAYALALEGSFPAQEGVYRSTEVVIVTDKPISLQSKVAVLNTSGMVAYTGVVIDATTGYTDINEQHYWVVRQDKTGHHYNINKSSTLLKVIK